MANRKNSFIFNGCCYNTFAILFSWSHRLFKKDMVSCSCKRNHRFCMHSVLRGYYDCIGKFISFGNIPPICEHILRRNIVFFYHSISPNSTRFSHADAGMLPLYSK